MNNYLNSVNRLLQNLRKIKKAMESPKFGVMIKRFNDCSESCLVSDRGSIWLEISTPAFTYSDGGDLWKLLEVVSEYCELISRDYPQKGQRTYVGKVTFRGSSFIIDITANLVEGEGLCKRIIVGEEEYEDTVYVQRKRPIYAFEC